MSVVTLLLCNTTLLLSQADQNTPKTSQWLIQANFQHQDGLLQEALSIGQLAVLYDVNIRPLFNVEAQYSIQKTTKKKKFFNVQLAYYSNTYHNEWLSLKLGYGLEWKIYKGLFLNYSIEAGLAHVQNSDVQYSYEGGKWVVTDNTDSPVIDVIFGPRMDLGYRVVTGENPIDVLISSNLLLHFDSKIGDAFPYYATGIGVRYGF